MKIQFNKVLYQMHYMWCDVKLLIVIFIINVFFLLLLLLLLVCLVIVASQSFMLVLFNACVIFPPGLFHRAIAESGTALSNWGSVDADAVRKHAIRVAEMLSCNTENTTTAVDCLRTMPTAALVQATIGLIIEVSDQKTLFYSLPVATVEVSWG